MFNHHPSPAAPGALAVPNLRGSGASNTSRASVESNYTIIKELGEGKFGQVKEVLRTGTKQRFAWKQVTSEKDPYYKVELEILGNLEHEGIIGVVEAYTQEGVVDMVLELCKISLQFDIDSRFEPAPMGGKKQYVRPSSWDIASTMLQIFSAVAFLHESQVAHRDIKPDNVLLSTGERWKLADFGLASRFKSGSYMEEVVGTQPFKAPEVEKGYYTEKCDVYSTGVLFIALATGKEWWRPENLEDETAKEKAIALMAPETWKDLELGHGAWEFAESMVSLEPERSHAEDALQNPWLVRKHSGGCCAVS